MDIENKLQSNIPLAPFTTFHIGGPADMFTIAKSEEELINAVKFARSKNISFFILGLGANILVGDKGFRGLVIKNETNKVSVDNNLMTAGSGATIENLIKISVEKGLSGLEHYIGIPSTLGGALWQNLHFLSPDRAKTVYISEILISARILTPDNTIKEVEKNYFKFGYDWSILREKKDVVLSATLQLTPEKVDVLQSRIDANLRWRGSKHPKNAIQKSAGSIFKKIESHGAGRLIQNASLKGYQVGGAKVSEVHANFILNTGSATAADVRKLISLIQEKVKQNSGLTLEPEITFVGEF